MQPSCTGVGCFKPSCRHCSTSHDDSPSSAKPAILPASSGRAPCEPCFPAHADDITETSVTGSPAARSHPGLAHTAIPGLHRGLTMFPRFPLAGAIKLNYNSRDAQRVALATPRRVTPIWLIFRQEGVNYNSQRALRRRTPWFRPTCPSGRGATGTVATWHLRLPGRPPAAPGKWTSCST